jgi:hypothetical protein
MNLSSIVSFWRVEKTTIMGMFTTAMGLVALTSGPGEGHVNWPHWVVMMAYWTVGPGALAFSYWTKTKGVTGGNVTPQGNPAPPVTMVEAAKPGAPDVPVQPVEKKP